MRQTEIEYLDEKRRQKQREAKFLLQVQRYLLG
jgi:hypothetical protein